MSEFELLTRFAVVLYTMWLTVQVTLLLVKGKQFETFFFGTKNYVSQSIMLNPNTFAGLVRRRKDRREGGEKKRAQCTRRTRGSNPGPAACYSRRGSPAACQGGCFDKQAFPCIYM